MIRHARAFTRHISHARRVHASSTVVQTNLDDDGTDKTKGAVGVEKVRRAADTAMLPCLSLSPSLSQRSHLASASTRDVAAAYLGAPPPRLCNRESPLGRSLSAHTSCARRPWCRCHAHRLL